MKPDNSFDGIPPSVAMILRFGLRQARLDALGGEPWEGSGFENEVPEPDYNQSE